MQQITTLLLGGLLFPAFFACHVDTPNLQGIADLTPSNDSLDFYVSTTGQTQTRSLTFVNTGGEEVVVQDITLTFGSGHGFSLAPLLQLPVTLVPEQEFVQIIEFTGLVSSPLHYCTGFSQKWKLVNRRNTSNKHSTQSEFSGLKALSVFGAILAFPNQHDGVAALYNRLFIQPVLEWPMKRRISCRKFQRKAMLHM